MIRGMETDHLVCSRRLEFDAAHRVLRHESKCAHLHGHRYVVEIVCKAPTLDAVGRVVDFGAVKDRVGTWIDEKWDHGTIVNREDDELLAWCVRNGQKRMVLDGEPTAENIARVILLYASREFDDDRGGLFVLAVRVWETPNCWAEARRNEP